MNAFGAYLESAPFNFDGYNGADLLGDKCGDDYIGSCGWVAGLDLNVEVGFRSYCDFGDEFIDFDLLFLILEKPIQHLHFNIYTQ